MSIQEQKITEAAVAESGVQSQPDKLTGTAAQNKKVFDNLVTAVVREKFNTLLDELTGAAAAAQLGITTIPGFSADNIQTALEQIVQAMQDVTQGSVTDGSITLLKLAAEVTAIALGGAAASHSHGAGDISSDTLEFSRIPVLDGTKLGTGSVGTAQLGAAAVTAEKLAALQADPETARLPVCIAKTQYSLSHDPNLLGRPKGWRLPVRDVLLYRGAGLVVPVAGEIKLMPGTSASPAYRRIDVDVETGHVHGLF